MKKIADFFPNQCIFFTDEVTDGMPCKALIEDKKGSWQFDAAIIPKEYELIFKCPPKQFKVTKENSLIYITRKNIWGISPWEKDFQ
ncbi:hypothetical protein [Vallitalea okinawensis]|uniref:hypothetical protein n=1 Tax=Vallitalea okinawensis TaxID=2078660 RepID=UPI000CFD06FC|nr:hypothetical protein [Vallitalea okinawensis]